MSFSKLGPILTTRDVSLRLKGNLLQNVCAESESDGVWYRDMADEGGRVQETVEGGENGDKMDVWSDIEGHMQE